jgi:cyclic pyranopterin phosphate synthase
VSQPVDRLGRGVRDLRISLTDRCNFRCRYCMPVEVFGPGYRFLPREDLLSFEELVRLTRLLVPMGVEKVRLTGGEPLLRKDLPILIERLAAKSRLEDLAMTTNGVLLGANVAALKRAGLHRITVSLDTLQHDRFVKLARYDELDRVLEGIDAAAPLFPGLKLDTVVIRGVNDDELVPLIEFAKTRAAEVRFIEYMDVGGATNWTWEHVVSRAEMLARLGAHYGGVTAVEEQSSAPADRFRLPDGTVFGIISSTTAPFCQSCDRSRLTADGLWFLCLYAARGIDLRTVLRSGATNEAIATLLSSTWSRRADRGAEARLALRDRSPLIPLGSLKRDPHLEMHTRGG